VWGEGSRGVNPKSHDFSLGALVIELLLLDLLGFYVKVLFLVVVV